MSTQIFTTAQECAAEVTRLRGQRIACRLQKLEGGRFTVVLMNGKAQPSSKAPIPTKPTKVKPKRESNFDVDRIMKAINDDLPTWVDETLHEDDQIKVLEFNISYRRIKGSQDMWQLFMPISKAAVMLSYLNQHASLDAAPDFPSAHVDVFEKGRADNFFVSLAAVVTIEDGDIPNELHNKLVEKFR
jgi:hypothetical protein